MKPGKPGTDRNSGGLAEQLRASGLVLLGDPECPVFKGDVVASLEDGVASGEISVSAKYFQHDKSRGVLQAKGFGLLALKDGELVVRPLLKVVEEKTAIKASLHHCAFDGGEVTTGRISGVLESMGFGVPVDRDAVDAALAEAKRTGNPSQSIIIARGERPEEGEPGRFEPAESEEAEAGNDLACFDPRERSCFRKVAEGEVLGRLVPPKPGKAGTDVFGNVIPPCESGEASGVTVGQGAELDEGGETVRATTPGLVSWRGNELNVLDALEIQGDVDFSTGNISLDKGSVLIKGSVIDGFRVEAPGDVTVKGNVQAATISAGGSVMVGCGILSGEHGGVYAGGPVRAQFMENSCVAAGGDITVAHNITNCHVQTEGKIVCTRGKGVVQGGTLNAFQGVECNEVGSEYGVVTTIRIGPQETSQDRKELLAKRQKIKDHLAKLDNALGTGDAREILERTPVDQRERVVKLLKYRSTLHSQQREIKCLLDEERRCFLDCTRATLKARRVVYPGARVVMLGRTLKIEETKHAPTIRFSMENMRFEIG
ncbi:DUF342 domain-containing protein [Desulfohalovibrio reitneri]|uniref:DUF342 domain-containing protein n=1 Tax=Desulfohalovibrio reitneri TaxID=1307759 RepID=UPI0004A780D7|nr:FapA family protein [Desulfohalovibrio reitneri]